MLETLALLVLATCFLAMFYVYTVVSDNFSRFWLQL